MTWTTGCPQCSSTHSVRVKLLSEGSTATYSGAMTTRSAVGRLADDFDEADRARALETLGRKRSRMVMTSGGLEPVLDGVGGQHSVFAKVFMEVLQANGGVMLGRDLFRQLQLQVNAMAQRADVPQVPEYAPIKYAGHEGGEFFFVRKGT